MAIQWTAAGQALSSTAGVSGISSYTITCLLRIDVDRNAYNNIIWMESGQRHYFITSNDGVTTWFQSSAGTRGNQVWTVGVWYQLAIVVSGTTVTVYRSPIGSALETASGSVTAATNQNNIYLGGSSINSDWFSGSMAAFKMWAVALTATEVENELTQYQPIRTDGLRRFHPFLTAEGTDYSGNGYNLSGSGASTVDGPPIRWGRSRSPRSTISAPTEVEALIEDVVEISVVPQDPQIDKLADLDLVTITADLSSIAETDKALDINVSQAVTVTPQNAAAANHVVVRLPLTTFATVEIPDVTVDFSSDITVDVENIEVDVSLIGLEPDLSKDIDLPDVVEVGIELPELDLAKATTEPGDPQFVTVELPAPTILQSSFGVPNIPVEVVPQDVEVGIAYDLDIIDVEVTTEEVTHIREISLDDAIEVEIVPEFVSVIQTAYAIQPIDIGVEAPADAVDIANEAELDAPAVSVSLDGQTPKIQHVVHLPVVEISTDPTDNSVITYQSYRVGIIEINTLTQEPELAHAADIELISIFTRLDGQEPDLAHIFDIATSRLITVEPRPASTQGFDDEPIEVNVEVLPVDVGFSVEDFSYVRGLRIEPFVEPARVIAQDIRTKKFLHWELPLSNLTIDYNLSGPTVISGSFDNEILDLQDLGLEANATWIHVEENGFIRASGILQPTSIDENETLTLEAVGPSSYPTGQPYDNKFEGINLDPADIIRVIWNHLQSYSDANLGVVVRGNTPVKLGKPLPPAPPDPLPEGYVDPNPNDNNDKPYSLLWWEAPDCGDEIGKLISETPMDYVEVATWNADKTDVLHFIDLGFPRAGRRRDDLSFVQDENLIRSIGPEELEGFWASNVILMGKGEGSSIIKGYAALPNPKRIRKTYIMTDPTCDNKTRADKLAMQELMRRQAVLDIKEIEADARHINARLGDFQLGDDIPVRGRIPWANTPQGDGEVYIWERVLGFTYTPDTESLRIRLRRSESFTYGSGATS